MADYIEFTVNVNEDSSVDSQSSIDEKIRNSSDRPSEDNKIIKQARENMRENNGDNKSQTNMDVKGIKAFIVNDVVKETVNTGIRIAQTSAIQEFTYGGNSAAMNRMNNKINQVKSTISRVSNIASYAAAGSVFGPYGTIIGAAIGVVMDAVDANINYNTNNAQLQWELQKERIEAQAEANRLGLAASGRGRISHREFKL